MGGTKEGKGNINVREIASHMHPDRGPNPHLDMCPDQESDQWLFACGTTPNQLSHTGQGPMFSHFIFLNDFIDLFLERGEGKEKERERNISVWLPFTWPPLGTWSTTQECSLTGNQTGDPLLCSSRSIHWATPARARNFNLQSLIQIMFSSN